MIHTIKTTNNHRYIEKGEGIPLILLHGLMGGLSNFDAIISYFENQGFRVLAPQLPIFSTPVKETNVESIAKYFKDFYIEVVGEPALILGNSLGGHIALIFALDNPQCVKGLILTGSSGLYEKGFGETFPKRSNLEYVRKKTKEVFCDPEVATEAVINDIYSIVNDNDKVIRLLYIARSAIKHNMKNDLPEINVPVCLIWGKQDNVTPPHVALEFEQGLPKSTLYWIDGCGHAPMMEHPDTFCTLLVKWLSVNQISFN